jgi:signal transduction histidine kinase
MVGGGEKPGKGRDDTDESLRTERKQTDRALAAQRRTAKDDADEVLQKARENADEVLETAREKADAQLAQPISSETPQRIVDKERRAEDRAIEVERSTADEALRKEREENAEALRALLPLERNKTDRFLLTERVRADEAVGNRDDFLGIVSHDLRSLLGGIVLTAQQLAKDAPEQADAAARIQRYGARMNRLIGDLLDVASIGAGRLSLKPGERDAAALIDEVIDLFRQPAHVKELTLRATNITRPLIAQFDHDRLLQVLVNLVTNAIKFTAEGGEIAISGERIGDELQFCVADTGKGIDPSKLDAVFERFWQAGDHDRRGLGLGLYISRNIIEAHGGKIWAESTLNKGSRFYFTLPAVSPAS